MTADPARGAVVQLPVVSDAAIVGAVLGGRRDGAAALYHRYAHVVRRMLMRVLGPDAELRDLTQDVFVAAIDGMDRLENVESLRGWLCGIAIRLARVEIRRRVRDQWLPRFEADDPPDVEAPSSCPEVDAAMRATYAILGKMGEDDRIVFALRFLEGMELTEIAESSGLSLATVKRRLARARHRFMTMARTRPELAAYQPAEGGA